MKTAVIYWSGTGNTQTMAQAVLEGMKSAGADADILKQYEEDLDWLIEERSAFGETDHTAFLTPFERDLIQRLMNEQRLGD